MFKDLVKLNRSYRGFDEHYPMDKAMLRELVDLARFCGTGANKQALKFRLVYEAQERDTVLALSKWAAALPQLNLPLPERKPAAFIVICQDLSIEKNLNAPQKDVGIAAQTILLGAVEAGFGGLMIGNFRAEALHQQLSLPESIKPLLLLALGKPMEEIILTTVGPDGSTVYYRDDEGRHYVPKRSLDELIID